MVFCAIALCITAQLAAESGDSIIIQKQKFLKGGDEEGNWTSDNRPPPTPKKNELEILSEDEELIN